MLVLVTRGGELAAPGPTCGDHSEEAAYTCNCGHLVSLDDGRRLDDVVVANRPDITHQDLAAAVTARLHANDPDDLDDPEYADGVAEFITDIASRFPVGTPLSAVYDHRSDEWNFIEDPRPELRRRVRQEPPRYAF